MKVKDIIIDRQARREVEGVELKEKQETNATQEIADKAIRRLDNAQFGSSFSSADQGMLETARVFNSGAADLAQGGSNTELADAKRKLGDIKHMMEEHDKDEAAKAARKQQKVSDKDTAMGHGDGAGSEADEKTAAEKKVEQPAAAIWHQRDTKIADALKNHNKWSEDCSPGSAKHASRTVAGHS